MIYSYNTYLVLTFCLWFNLAQHMIFHNFSKLQTPKNDDENYQPLKADRETVIDQIEDDMGDKTPIYLQRKNNDMGYAFSQEDDVGLKRSATKLLGSSKRQREASHDQDEEQPLLSSLN